ncbi:MAG: hypothetical protein RL497_427 [Pseudomonadota bacterium]
MFASIYDTAAKGYSSVYLNFTDFEKAGAAPQTLMRNLPVGNTVAPQVFYFAPQKKWYLITQWNGSYSTTSDISNVNSWTAKKPLLTGEPSDALDFWTICNDTHCYLFFSRDDGKLYLSKTTIENFPKFSGYTTVMSASKASLLFEASNVYKIDGTNKYLLMVEAYDKGPRFFRSWTSTSLDGPWTVLADTEQNPFAGNNNVAWPGGKWADGISHGEMIRSGYDEKLTVDPCNLQFLYQGQAGSATEYNKIPYKLGLITLKKS